MKTTVKHGFEGAEAARGTVVLIDVFRASNTMLMLLNQGAASVIPVMTVKEAFELKDQHPDYLLVGERKGVTVTGFDMGNSPCDASRMHLKDLHVIMTTSAGTQAIWRAKGAERILVGSFGNARPLARLLNRTAPALITWLAAGTEGVSRAIEDDLCALYLDKTLKGEPARLDSLMESILTGEGAQRLRRLGQEDDFHYCLTTDLFDFVPRVVWPESGESPCRVVTY